MADLPEGWKLNRFEEIEQGIVKLGARDGDGNFYAIATIDTDTYDQPDAAIPIARAIIDALNMRVVGEAFPMSGSASGFTMVVFKATDVPVGTKLYKEAS